VGSPVGLLAPSMVTVAAARRGRLDAGEPGGLAVRGVVVAEHEDVGRVARERPGDVVACRGGGLERAGRVDVEVGEDAVLDARVEPQVDVGQASRAGVAVGHDGAAKVVAGAPVAAVVDGGGVGTVGVPGAEVVPQLVADDDEVPVLAAVLLEGVGEGAVHVGRDAEAPLLVADHAEVGDAAVGGVGAGEQVGQVALDMLHRGAPVVADLVERVGIGRAGVGVDIAREGAEEGDDQADIDIPLVDLADRGHQEQRVLRGGLGVAAEPLGRPLPVGVDRDPRDAAGGDAPVGRLARELRLVVDGLPERGELIEVRLVDRAGRASLGEVHRRHVGDHQVRRLGGHAAAGARRDAEGRPVGFDEAVGRVGADADDDERVGLARDAPAEQGDLGARVRVVVDQEDRVVGPDIEGLEFEVDATLAQGQPLDEHGLARRQEAEPRRREGGRRRVAGRGDLADIDVDRECRERAQRGGGEPPRMGQIRVHAIIPSAESQSEETHPHKTHETPHRLGRDPGARVWQNPAGKASGSAVHPPGDRESLFYRAWRRTLATVRSSA
jgi:hypothetical protein